MKRAISNAFTRSPGGFRNPCRSLAGSLASMQVKVEKSDRGFHLVLNPMSTFDAVGAWTLMGSQRPHLTIIVDASVQSELGNGTESLGTVATRWDITVDPVGDGVVMASDTALRQLMTLSSISSVTLLRVSASIRTEDAAALARAIRDGAAPLDQPGVIAALSVGDDHVARLEARRLDHVLRLVSENFRHYLAAICNQTPATFSPVPIDVLRPWLDEGGAITVRPIETEVYSTFVDIGVCPADMTGYGPAAISLIYDRPSATWHGGE